MVADWTDRRQRKWKRRSSAARFSKRHWRFAEHQFGQRSVETGFTRTRWINRFVGELFTYGLRSSGIRYEIGGKYRLYFEKFILQVRKNEDTVKSVILHTSTDPEKIVYISDV